MNEYTINCAGLASAGELHTLLSHKLEIPGHYDGTQDALYGYLTSISQETRITIYGLDTLEFADEFRSTFQDAENDNFWLNISIE